MSSVICEPVLSLDSPLVGLVHCIVLGGEEAAATSSSIKSNYSPCLECLFPGIAQEFLSVYQALRNELIDDELLVGQPNFARTYLGEVCFSSSYTQSYKKSLTSCSRKSINVLLQHVFQMFCYEPLHCSSADL